MALAPFQRALLRLYTEASYRQAFGDDPAREISALELTETEGSALRQLVATRAVLDDFGNGLLAKRYGYLWKHYRTVEQLFPSLRKILVRRFRETCRFLPGQMGDDVRTFGDFLLAEAPADLPSCFRDVVVYERLLALVSTVDSEGAEAEAFDEGPSARPRDAEAAGTPELLLESLPARMTTSASVMVQTFAHDVFGVTALTSIEPILPTPVVLAFVPALSRPQGDVYRLTRTLAAMVDSARGRDVVLADLVATAAEVNDVPPGPELEELCVPSVLELLRKRILVSAGTSGS